MAIRRFNIELLLPLLQQGFTLLTPNNRSVDGILREYASARARETDSLAGWQRPLVFAIDIYIQQLWQLAASHGIAPFSQTTLLNRFDEQELWLQIVESSYEKYPLLNSEETANSVARSYRFFKQWNVAALTNSDRYRGAVDFQTFLEWSNQFELACEQSNILSLSDAGALITANSEKLKPLLPQKIALINFEQPPPLYSELFKALSRVSTVERKNENIPIKKLSSVFSDSKNKTSNWIYQNSREEVAGCVSWCQSKAQESPQAHIGIIVDPNRALEAMVEETLLKLSNTRTAHTFDIANYVNRYHSNEKLDETPDIHNAMTILSLNYDLVDSERFCKILQSPRTVGAAGENQARIALEITLRKKAEVETRLSQLRQFMLQKNQKHYCPLLATALLDFSEMTRHVGSRQTLRHWLQLFSKQLQILGWPGTESVAENQRLASQWQQSMQRFSASSAVLGEISINAALKKLHTFLKQSNVNLNFDTRLQISMLDIEEAQDFVFDHVWVLAVDNENWPQAIKPVPFLPYRLQQDLDMPGSSNQQQLDAAIAQFTGLRLSTSGDIVISHHTLEGELSIRPSPLLKEISFDDIQGNAAVTNDESTARARPAIPLEKFQDTLHIPLRNEEEVIGGTGLLSNQSNCPFRAFAKNRLRATALDEFSHGLNPLTKGNALHKALEHIGGKLGNSAILQEQSASDLEALVTSSAIVATDYLRKHYPEIMSPAFTELEQQRLSNLLNGFLTLEKQRTEFSILQNEMELHWTHSKLALTLRIDRIDQLADGTLALIDYKTGKHTSYKWLDERPDDMQLPLYQIALHGIDNQDVGATLIFQLNAENTGLISPLEAPNLGVEVKTNSQAKSFAGDWPALQEYWNQIIYSLVDEFESGLVAIAPTRGKLSCRFCDLGPLCRITEADHAQLQASED